MRTCKGFTLLELIIVIVILALFFSIAAGSLGLGRVIGGVNDSYSNSTRVGKIVKFGEKTNVFGGYKSWEGAMQISDFGLKSSNQLNSSMSGNVWEFSLYATADKALTDKILLALKEQRPISLTYNQWWSRPATISTEYVITAADFPEDAKKSEK